MTIAIILITSLNLLLTLLVAYGLSKARSDITTTQQLAAWLWKAELKRRLEEKGHVRR